MRNILSFQRLWGNKTGLLQAQKSRRQEAFLTDGLFRNRVGKPKKSRRRGHAESPTACWFDVMRQDLLPLHANASPKKAKYGLGRHEMSCSCALLLRAEASTLGGLFIVSIAIP